MLRNYPDKSDEPQEAPGKPGATPCQDPLRELQTRYAETLAACYALCAQGHKCRFEEGSDGAFDCARCKHSGKSKFCKANLRLKKIVSLAAECLAQRANPAANAESPPEKAGPQPGWTAEAVESFRAKGMAYEIKTPLCGESVWIVPEKTGRDRVEFTPEEMSFLVRTADAVGGKLVALGREAADASVREFQSEGESE